MSPLASSIYRQLRRRVRQNRASITYGQLARSLGRLATHHRDPRFHAALGEVAHSCRHAGLPCLPAIVWRADTDQPSDGYYAAAHPRVHGDGARRAVWEREHERVLRAAERFPVKL
jgi:hypothetical protein